MADFVAAVDQGTTGTRCMIFDHGGNEIARHQLEHSQILRRSGWVEHNPVEIWERTSSVIQATLKYPRPGGKISATPPGRTGSRPG
jgi:glycerol kinase